MRKFGGKSIWLPVEERKCLQSLLSTSIKATTDPNSIMILQQVLNKLEFSDAEKKALDYGE